MITTCYKNSRRGFLGTCAASATAFTARGAFADELSRTPTTNEGPFFPRKLPLDTDNDLLLINDAITPAVGEITHLSGRLLDLKGNPLRNAVIEIWQCDRDGTYLKQHQQGEEAFDKNFQGYGPLSHELDRRILLPDDQARSLPRSPGCAHPRASLEGNQEAADHRVFRQGSARQRAGRPVQADPGPRCQGARHLVP